MLNDISNGVWGKTSSSRTPAGGRDALLQLLKERGKETDDIVEWTGWKRIDAVEKQRGVEHGKLRDKLDVVSEMLSVGAGKK